MENLTRCTLCNSKNIISAEERYNIYCCQDCKFIFDNPRPTAEEITRFYSQEDKYDSWLREEKGRDILWKKRLAKIRKYKKGGSLLDVGAGIGQFLHFASRYFEVFGTEVSDSAIRIAKEKYHLDLIKGSIEDIDFGGRRFDVITIVHVLEHVAYPAAFIEKCYNLLAKDGVMVIAVPNDIYMFTPMLVARGIQRLVALLSFGKYKASGFYGLPKITLKKRSAEIHLSHFTEGTLKRLLRPHELKIIEMTLDPLFSTVGYARCRNYKWYFIFLFVKMIFKVNLYDAIWVSAVKRS